MSDQLLTSVVTVLLAITGVAILAVLVSKNANTAGVLTAGASAYSTALGTALSPITGGGAGTFNFGGGASYLG
jgi:hypothetical protein